MIAVIGEALVDLVAEDRVGGYRAVPGGSPANVALALARLEQPVRLLARLSGDGFGQRIGAHLRDNGVDLAWAVSADEPTSLAVATLDDSGQASYQCYLNGTADWQWTASELPNLAAAPVTALHSGSLALALPPGATVLEDLFARERRRGALTLSIDLNLRPSIVADRDGERQRVERQVRSAHIVKASEEDLGWLYPGRAVEEVMADWRAAGAACSVVTLGAVGSCLLAPDGRLYRQPARRVDVVDTVGAGDAFTGGLLAALADVGALGDRPGARLTAVAPEQWRQVLDLASTVAALTCARRGADPPTLAHAAAAMSDEPTTH
ncbi:carbohydrate kinase [Micromonospora sp. WMMA1363]|uniref:carbohydrate kinase family protein n=1 Tax=Micromonospora sp. WMMA1363 TaxID=3053985 RepID=UPI00259C9DC7|nr:carbohydrate kinase [Micromonospora sp. WMMA1363]MDM4718698.1 carbohydrate kinase [Micromonospora sp. WMMA1363]